jgi:hypothetical protein
MIFAFKLSMSLQEYLDLRPQLIIRNLMQMMIRMMQIIVNYELKRNNLAFPDKFLDGLDQPRIRIDAIIICA